MRRKRRKRWGDRAQGMLYSSEGLGLWSWVLRGLHLAAPSPLDIIKGYVLILTALAIGLELLVGAPLLWFVVAGFALTLLMVRTMYEMFLDMKRERDKARALVRMERRRFRARVRKERERVCDAKAALDLEQKRLEAVCQVIIELVQRGMAGAIVPQTLTPIFLINNINFNDMNFFGNVDMNGGSIYGDNAVHNETHHHYGNEQKKGDWEAFPALALLTRLVMEGKTPKDTLMPYRAAREAGALLPPMPSVKDFNERFDKQLSPVNYSTYITSVNNPFENDHDTKQFRIMVSQFEQFGNTAEHT